MKQPGISAHIVLKGLLEILEAKLIQTELSASLRNHKSLNFSAESLVRNEHLEMMAILNIL